MAELLGEPERARELARKARALAPDDRAEVLEHARDGDTDDGATVHLGASPPTRLITALSRAERRVAALAAAGFTNREISEKLYITVSTVEQHLTRVYRKLNVKRFDLPAVLRHEDVNAMRIEVPTTAGTGSGANGLDHVI